jgi:hypothetical protein
MSDRIDRLLRERLARVADPTDDGDWKDVLRRSRRGSPRHRGHSHRAPLRLLLATPAAPTDERRRARRRLRGSGLVAVGATAVAAVVSINVLDSDAPGAGVIDRAVAAVTREDSVYHALQRGRATGSGLPKGGLTAYSESWHTTDGRVHAKTFAANGSRRGRLLEEFAGRRRPGRTSGQALRYDPRENTITESGFGRAPDADAVPDIDPFGDPGAQLRALQAQGRLRLAGTTHLGGKRAYRLVSDSTTRWRSFAFERVEYLVDSETYLPLSQRVAARVESERTYRLFTRYLVYERLPLDARSRAQLALDPHPGAECSRFAGDLTGDRDLGFPNPCPPSD